MSRITFEVTGWASQQRPAQNSGRIVPKLTGLEKPNREPGPVERLVMDGVNACHRDVARSVDVAPRGPVPSVSRSC